MTNTLTVFDVGLHTGQDTAFYLSLGHKVVAVEANPLLVSQARQRFREAIGSGRLFLVEGCIAGQGSGVVSFYVNQTDSALSSFCRHAAGRMGHSLEEIVVNQVQLGPLLREHGVPHYLKIDIEGADKFCLEELTPGNLPAYLSMEVSAPAVLKTLKELGYNYFKLVEQRHLHQLDECISIQQRMFTFFGSNFGDRRFQVRVRRRLARWLWLAFRRIETLKRKSARSAANPGWHFEEGCSGPFGEEAPGVWKTFEEMSRIWERHLAMHQARGTELWCDVHAKACAV